MLTRSMQREKEKRQNLCDAVKSLPNLSGILIRAINLCKSAKGLSFAELKDVLGTKGYDVSRYCPSVKRQLKSLASKGALLRMTHKAGSSFFVIRKHHGKEGTTQPFMGSEKILRMQKMGARRTNSQRVPEKMKGVAVQAKSSGLKAAKASRKVQRPNRKWKLGKRQPRQRPGQSNPTKTFQSPIRKSMSTVKWPNSSATKILCYSRVKPAASRKTVRNSRRATVNTAKKLGSPIIQAASRRSRWSGHGGTVSEKGLGGPYSHTASNVKASKYSRGKTPSTGKRERRPRGKPLFLPPGSNSRAASNTKRPRRR